MTTTDAFDHVVCGTPKPEDMALVFCIRPQGHDDDHEHVTPDLHSTTWPAEETP